MPTYMGNAGHLMQHWTLCELLDIADENAPGLSFIDAHAMAPVAYTRNRSDARFDRARCARLHLPDQQSVYERAWSNLALTGGYPNSASFVNQVWTRDFSMLLCENDPATISELDSWLPSVQGQPRCNRAKVFPGDWRDRFARGLPNPSEVGLPKGSLTLVSFDPDMYYPIPPANAPIKNLYPDDLTQTLAALGEPNDGDGGVIIQLSTYSRGNRNQAPQAEVIHSANGILTGGGFDSALVVKLDGNMMSLVYARNVSWWTELADLSQRFTDWIAPLRHS